MEAYGACLSATSSDNAPWHIIPADDKKNARIIIAKIIVEAFKSLDMHYPVSDEKRIAELEKFRKKLA